MSFTDTVGALTSDQFDVTDQITVTAPLATPGTATLAGAPDIRCDSIIGGRRPGCVVPDYTPTYEVSLTTWGAAAAGISWIQNNLPDHWGVYNPYGTSNPLTRLANPTVQAANRRAICRDGTFTRPSPPVPNDSCDEFPFAASNQSGAQLGLTGAQCSEIVPSYDPATGTVSVIVIHSNPADRCVRAHVALTLNNGVGRILGGTFTPGQRLLDGDPYWVDITP
jgi:hypothetical protein